MKKNFYKTPASKKVNDNLENHSAKESIKTVYQNSQTGPGSSPATGGTRNQDSTPVAATGITGHGESSNH